MGARTVLYVCLLAGWLALPAGPVRGDDAAIARFTEALRFETISFGDPANWRSEPFLDLHRHLEASFPRVHQTLQRDVVGDYSLLYTWRGSDSGAAPILLTSHLDVVPVPGSTLEEWDQPPFSGAIADGFIWGRGTLDNKYGVVASLEAVERLLSEGFTPSRTVYLAFGHNEEIGGQGGAAAITDLLASRGVQLAWSLDEGLAVISGAVPGLEAPTAMIGIAEKGYATFEITARAEGGHSSTPPREGAIGRLSRAIARIEGNPMPGRMDIAGGLFDAIGPHVEGVQGFAMRNHGLLGPVLRRVLSGSPVTDAMLRTTTAVTIVRGGTKENILPRSATATVNFRLFPGDTPEDVAAHLAEVIDDEGVEIELLGGNGASAVSSDESRGFTDIAAAIARVFPDAIVAPGLVLAATDTRHYSRIADDAYRFGPLVLTTEDAKRIHGVNERIGVENYLQCIEFYEALVRQSAGPGGERPAE